MDPRYKILWFERQIDAFKVLERVQDPHQFGLFVYQRQDGRRKFGITSWEKFGEKYLPLHEGHRHFYEVIREGQPSKLYLDVDVQLERNQQANCMDGLKSLIKLINNGLKSKFNININVEEIIQLDSSSKTKFSRHLVYPSVIFQHNVECGYFVKGLADAVQEYLDDGKVNELTSCFEREELEKLFIKRENNSSYFIADLSVYSRNRQFRIWRSTKLGQNRFLQIAEENEYSSDTARDFLQHSLVTSTPQIGQQPVLLTCERPRSRMRPYKNTDTTQIERVASKTSYLDDYVLDTIRSTENYENVSISRIVYYPQRECVIYAIDGSRWCKKLGRHHSQNRPYFVADMKKGTLYQKCPAMDCRGYRSTSLEIPPNIRARYVIGDEQELIKLLDETEFTHEEIFN